MWNVSGRLRHILQPVSMLLKLVVDAVCYLGLCLCPNPKLAAEVLFLRKQLALYEERQINPRRATDAIRIVMFLHTSRSKCAPHGVACVKTPVRTPVAKAICERVIGTMRRECMDFLIPVNEGPLHGILNEWIEHDNEGRPHMSLGPGMPLPPMSLPVSLQGHRHQMPKTHRVEVRPILGGLHHEYELENQAA